MARCRCNRGESGPLPELAPREVARASVFCKESKPAEGTNKRFTRNANRLNNFILDGSITWYDMMMLYTRPWRR